MTIFECIFYQYNISVVLLLSFSQYKILNSNFAITGNPRNDFDQHQYEYWHRPLTYSLLN